jgi:hypothetical protein
MDPMGQTVEQGAGESLTAEDFGPLVEREIAGDQNRALFIALTKDFEQEFGTDLGKGNKAELIDDEQSIGG